MAGRTAVLAIRILADSSQARREMDRTGESGSRVGRTLGKLTGPATAVVGGLALIGKTALDSASELQQATGATQSVFGRYADTVIQSSKRAAEAVGLSQSEYLSNSNLLASQLKNLGAPMSQVAGLTDGLIGKASDLAATFGGTTAQAVEAIGSLMKGEADPIERYGVSINAAAIAAYEAAHGTNKLSGAAATAAKRQAILALLNKQTAAATGQFARETSTAAGAQEIANAKYENAKAALGQRLLPVVAKFRTLLAEVAGWVARNSGVFFTLATVLGGLAAAVLVVNGATKAITATTKAWTSVQAAYNLVMGMNPIFRIVLIVTALAGALVLAYQKSQTFRDIVNGAFQAVMAVVEPFVSFFTTTIPHAFLAIVSGLHTAWDAVVGFIKTWGPRALLFLAPFIGIPLMIYRHFGQIVGWLSGVWSSVVGGARSFVSTAVGAILSIPGRIGSLAADMFHAGASFIGAFFRGIGNIASSAGNFAVSIARSIVNAIITGLNNLLDLPWDINLHIPIPYAPDIDFGPYTVLPRIPMWSSVVPDAPGPDALPSLMPGWSLLASTRAILGTASPSYDYAGASARPVQQTTVRVEFSGLVTDPEAVAREIRRVLGQSDARRGLTRVPA